MKARRAIWCGLWLLALSGAASAQPLSESLERERSLAKVKAAYLFNIARFVNWPDAAPEIRLCIHDKSSVLRVAEALHGRSVGNGRALQVTSGDQLHGCHIFLAPDGWTLDAVKRGAPDVLRRTLVIGDTGPKQPVDASLQFYFDDGKLRFFVVDHGVQRAEFRISSKLMRLARQRSTRS